MSSVFKASFFHIRNVSRIRKYLSVESTKILVHAFVTCSWIMGTHYCTDFQNILLNDFKLS